MPWRSWGRALYGLLRPGRRQDRQSFAGARGVQTHVIILDGTMSSLEDGCESNAGLTYKLLCDRKQPNVSLYYEAGLQWQDWRATGDVLFGRGINRQIQRAYGYLASRYHPGDRIFLMGYSRGAFAVRSLAGVIDRIGLLRAEHATERNVTTAYRHYRSNGGGAAAQDFARAYCHATVEIEMVGVWDTVKALGLRLPILWRWSEPAHAFHNHQLGASVKHGYHALALDETRAVFTPVMWLSDGDLPGHVEQVWFRGSHGDVGGQLNGFDAARPLSNLSLVWMLERAVVAGLELPPGWQARFPQDPSAPSTGTWRGWGKLFLARNPRRVGEDPSERLHSSVAVRAGNKLNGSPDSLGSVP
ncbi:DUF2235 domain-containing protein [Roseovarius faecimaris]|uniref:DUF2235 domain-containing protein n=1 Tax=Roseovarius faecimaris TaxID=2494550 RepID=A0A6I6IYK7_9RHOB|nr:DUF2235 domain-containing protein [Roseovarius faecimaris]QGX97688.1 DUF2235 domain-containing protein [Roseovarius faecimaris]